MTTVSPGAATIKLAAAKVVDKGQQPQGNSGHCLAGVKSEIRDGAGSGVPTGSTSGTLQASCAFSPGHSATSSRKASSGQLSGGDAKLPQSQKSQVRPITSLLRRVK